MKGFLVSLLLLVPCLAYGQEHVLKLYAGADVVSYDGTFPSDFEAGLNGRASLSPHIAVVGSGKYGFDQSYLQWKIGPRITATDVNNRDFSIGIGTQYATCSDPDIRPNEWQVDASLGWRPRPVEFPKFIVGAQAGYGLTSNVPSLDIAVRYELGAWVRGAGQ